MAGDSLGTMTVGVSANVTDAERALNSLARLLEKVDRQQQSRSRSGGGRRGGGGGYFSPMSEEFQDEVKRLEELDKRTQARLRFREIRNSEMSAARARAESIASEAQMSAEAEKFRRQQQKEIDNLQVLAEKEERALRRRIDNLQAYAEKQQRIEQQQMQRDEERRRREVMSSGLRGYGPFTQGQIEAEQERVRQLRGRTESRLRFREIRESEMSALRGRQLDEHMNALGEAFKAGGHKGAEEFVNKTTRGIQQIGDTAARTRFAVMNVAYGVQDFAQVLGTGGFPAAIRASANNMVGLAVLFDKTAYASGGLAAALATPEMAFIAFSTAALLGADALEKYIQAQAKAAREAVELERGPIGPGFRINAAVEQVGFKQQLRDAKEAVDAERLLKNKRDELATQDERIQASLRERAKLQKEILDTEFRLGLLMAAAERARTAAQQRTNSSAPVMNKPTPGTEITEDEQETLKLENKLELEQKLADLKKDMASIDKDHEQTLQRSNALKKEILATENKLQQLRDDERRNEAFAMRARFEEAGNEELRQFDLRQESDLEYRVSFLGRKRRDLERSMRIGNQFTGVAPFESATAYEALARARMGPAPESDTLKRILAAEEKATAALEDIREKLDPGRRERLVLLETFE